MTGTHVLTLMWLAVAATCNAQHTGDCVERKRAGGRSCYMSARKADACEKSHTDSDYYQGFTTAGGTFNRPAEPGGCLPWRFFLAGDNCRDNEHFNPVQSCNTINPGKPYAAFPRLAVEGGGRLGGDDRCVRITCYPGDNFHTNAANGRSEMVFRPGVKADSSYWYAWSFRLPGDFRLDDRSSCSQPGFRYTHCIISQIHTTEKEKAICDDPGIPFNMNLRSEKGGLVVAVNFGALCGDQAQAHQGRFPVVRERWYDVVLNITWSADLMRSRMGISVYEEGAGNPVFETTATGVPGFFRDEGNGFLIFHMGAYVGKKLCNPVSVQFDEFSFARQRCCLKSPRVSCPCD